MGLILEIVDKLTSNYWLYKVWPKAPLIQVPATTKSSGVFGHPIRSIAEMKGSPLTGSNPLRVKY